MTESTPGSGPHADPGFVLVIPGRGEIIMEPVSVCHHVSTIAHCSFQYFRDTTSTLQGLLALQQIQVILMSLNRELLDVQLPHFINARIAVGAV